MSLIKKIKNFFEKLFDRLFGKRGTRKKKVKIKLKKPKVKPGGKIAKKKIKLVRKKKVVKKIVKKKLIKKIKPTKKLKKGAKYKEDKHVHETELKVVGKQIGEYPEYVGKPEKGKVSLKIKEKGVFEYEEPKKKVHEFKFRKRKLSKKEQETLGKISEILKSKEKQQLIITNIDLLLEIVNKLEKVRIDYIAESLKLEEKHVEELAGILEDKNLIDIDYPIFGKMIFKNKGGKED